MPSPPFPHLRNLTSFLKTECLILFPKFTQGQLSGLMVGIGVPWFLERGRGGLFRRALVPDSRTDMNEALVTERWDLAKGRGQLYRCCKGCPTTIVFPGGSDSPSLTV